MNTPFLDRQGFGKLLSGVSGSAIQSAYTKPVMEAARGATNFSWLPYPYGELPDYGPWSKNDKEEAPTPETQPETDVQTDKPPWYGESANNIIMFSLAIGAVLLISSKTKILR